MQGVYQYKEVIACVLYTYIGILNLAYFKIKAKEILVMILLTIIASIVAFEINANLKIIPMIIGSGIYVYRNTKSILHSTLFATSSAILLIIIDYAVCAVYYILFNTNGEMPEFGLAFIAIATIVMFLVSRLLGEILKKSKLKFIDMILNFRFLILMMISVTIIVIKICSVIGIPDNSDANMVHVNAVLFFILCTLIIIMVYIIFKGVIKESELKNKQVNFNILQDYTNKIENLYSDMRAFKHDYANIISSIIGYIDEDDMVGLRKHFYDNILPLSQEIGKNDIKIAGLKNMRIVEVKGLLSSKLIRAQEMGIEVLIDIKDPIEKINMHIIDLTRALGILLDNAIEEGENNDKHIIRVSFIREDRVLIILISNSCGEDIPPIHKINKKGYSTKGKNRGIGLSNLKDILDIYKGITLDTIIQDGEFIQKITLDNNFEENERQ